MEFNDKQMKAMEIYFKSKDKMHTDPNYQLSQEEIQARFLVEHDEAIQSFLNDSVIKENESSIYSTQHVRTLKLNNPKSNISQMGYANIVLMSIIVIILVAIICVFIFL